MRRKNWLFCWTVLCWTVLYSSGLGTEIVGKIQSLLVTYKLHGINPYTYLVDVLQRIDSHPVCDVDLLTPRLWKQHFAHAPLRSDVAAVR